MIERVSGILLDYDDAAYIVKALELMPRLFAAQGSRPTPRLEAVTDRLRRKTDAPTDVSARNSGVGVRDQGAQGNSCNDMGYEIIDTTDVARILQCTPGNARDLARRKVLPARRVGGRWVFQAEAVMRRAAER